MNLYKKAHSFKEIIEQREQDFGEFMNKNDSKIIQLYTDRYMSNQRKYMDNWLELRAFALWYPDLFIDLLCELSDSKFKLNVDQRIALRLQVRSSSYTQISCRRHGKSFIIVLGELIRCIFIPNYTVAYSAQTREQSSKILQEKMSEILNFFPFLRKELDGKPLEGKVYTTYRFINGAKFMNAINGSATKGSTFHAIIVDEASFVSQEVLDDALIPTITPRPTIKTTRANPYEIPRILQISSAPFYGSSAHERFLTAFKKSAECDGTSMIWTDYRVPLVMRRSLTLSKIKEIKEDISQMAFKMNYESIPYGNTDGSLINVEDIEIARTVEEPEFQAEDGAEYLFAYDVARSWEDNRDDSALVIGKIFRHSDGTVGRVAIVNIITVSGQEKFEKQALRIKKLDELFNPLVIITDSNVIGMGLTEALMNETEKEDGTFYPAYNTLNTPEIPETENYVTKLFALQSSRKETKNSDMIKNLIESFARHKVNILAPIKSNVSNKQTREDYIQKELPYHETDLMIEESFNLKLNYNEKTDTVTMKQRTKGTNKDKIVTLMYLLFYAFSIMNDEQEKRTKDTSKYLNLWS
jgi:hypothetical protein